MDAELPDSSTFGGPEGTNFLGIGRGKEKKKKKKKKSKGNEISDE
jgi:hypothetical protein